eukprot:gene22258-27220_t
MEVVVIRGAWHDLQESELKRKVSEEVQKVTNSQPSLSSFQVDDIAPKLMVLNLPEFCWNAPSEGKSGVDESQAVQNVAILELLEVHAISEIPCLVVFSEDGKAVLKVPLYFSLSNVSIDAADSISTWLRAGIDAFESLDLHTACQHMCRILAVDRHHRQALYNLACIFHTAQYFVLAIGALKQLLLLDSKDHICHNLLYSIVSCHCPQEANEANSTNSPSTAMRSKRILHIGLQAYQELIAVNQDVQAIMRYNAILANFPNSLTPDLSSEISSKSPLNDEVNSSIAVYQHRGHQEYVKEVFNALAGDFESRLVNQLGYKAPWRLAHMVKQRLEEQGRGGVHQRVLDLGCGSGLFAKIWTASEKGSKSSSMFVESDDKGGNSSSTLPTFVKAMFADCSSGVLVGIDLSDKMVDICRCLCLYDYLLCTHISDCLQHCKTVHDRAEGSFDVVISADTFIYVGRLGEVFSLIAGVMPNGGLFAFSIEELTVSALFDKGCEVGYDLVEWIDREPVWHGQCDWGVRLSRAVRYAHSVLYIRLLAKKYGFNVLQEKKEVLRMESNEPIMGVIYLLEKVS